MPVEPAGRLAVGPAFPPGPLPGPGPVSLVDVTLDDLDWIADAAEQWDRSYRWSLRGRSPTPDLVGDLVFADVELQAAAVSGARRPLGLFQVSGINTANGYGQLDLLLDPGCGDSLHDPLEGFVARAFRQLGLRKLCVQAVDGELDVEQHLAGSACRVGRLAAHERRGPDDYADLLVYEVWQPRLLDEPSDDQQTGGGTTDPSTKGGMA